MTTGTEDELHGELNDELVGAMQRVPELAGKRLTLVALSGGITNRNYRVDVRGEADRCVIRLGGRARAADITPKDAVRGGPRLRGHARQG